MKIYNWMNCLLAVIWIAVLFYGVVATITLCNL